jgi:exodeoxyribonuclease V alpha subunit
MKPTPESSTQEVLAGLVERVTFHNSENGFCVLRAKARGHRDPVTVVGHAATISAGEWITASGEWINERAHGQQFKARFLKTSAPSSIDGIEKYLGSGMIRGIGPAYAKKMVKAFGDKVFDVIEAEPDRLREVTGIGAVRAKRITDAWAEQKIVREIMVFLHSNGVGTARAVRIFKTYGADAVQVMTENPYRLARDIRGIGFKSADAIAMKLGIEKTAMIRLRAGISYALTEAMDEGHCGLPTDQLIPLAEELLEAPTDLILTALELEQSDGAVIADKVGDTACMFLAGLYRAEQAIADRLIRIVTSRLPWPWIDEEKAVPWVEKRSGLQLAESQRTAIRLALTAKALVITGGPGVGKTTIVNSILKTLAAKGVRLLLCAPTGRAAKRMTEATGVEAKTIHRLLEVDPKSGGFKRNADNPLECDLLVVDEASMVDVMLMQALMKGTPDNGALLIVGDIDQLPSVGPGQVLADIIGSGAVPVVRLTEVFRQAAASRIIVNAHRINQGLMPESRRACRRERLLLRSGRRSRDRRSTHLGIGEDPHPQTLRLEPDPRHPGALPDEPRRRRRSLAQHRAAGGVEPRRRMQGRAFRLDLCAGRQGDADRERLRQGGLQRRHRLHRRRRSRGWRSQGQLRRALGDLWLRRA